MTTAIDSSVIWAILKKEKGCEGWLNVLFKAAEEGPLLLCSVSFAELAPSTSNAAELCHFLDTLTVTYSPLVPDAAHLAGTMFKRYRQAGGPREHLVPDFLIAAHASIQADRLAAIDRGYLRRWFPELTLLTP